MEYSVKELLDNYRADLMYQSASGLRDLNNRTSGTPEFEDWKEFEHYIAHINLTINTL